MISGFFKNLFSSCSTIPIPAFALPKGSISSAFDMLVCVPSPLEIKQALWSLKPFKAAGPDGFQPYFFQKNWDVVGPSVIDAISSVFSLESIPESWNETFICLIPKCLSPSEMKSFRPISLCTTIYKVLTKTPVARLRPHISSLISWNQGAFVPGRQALDNIVIAQDIVSRMKRNKHGRYGWVVVKLDLFKAYDKVNWGFLNLVLEAFKFPNKWVKNN